MRVVRLANYVAPASGGLRTSLRELGAGYQAAGHEPVLVIPGPEPGRRHTEQGLVITVPGERLPGTGGYRAILTRRPLRRLLDQLEPDRLEVSDRTTLRWTGAWARACGVRSMMVSHDSLAGLMAMFSPPGVPAARLADHFNRRTAASYDVVVCTTAWAAAEFRRLGVPNLLQVPFGVDLACFSPQRRDEGLRARLAPGGQALLVHCSRLSPEKRPQRAIGALAELRRRGLPAVLVVAGDGPQRRALQAQARASLPDPGLLLRIPASIRRPLARRAHEINTALGQLAVRYDLVHVDLAAAPEIYDRRMWGVDRLHPSERGHRMLAAMFAARLAERGMPPLAPPDPEPANPEPGAWRQAHWMATKGTGWMVRRSRDLLPGLLQLALAEWWHSRRGRDAGPGAAPQGRLDEPSHADRGHG